MTLTVGKYTFNAWLRRGIGRSISETDTLGATDGTVKERASVPIDVAVNTQPVHKDFPLLGPGDVIGISQALVVRTEPQNWLTDFEPNYLAFIEFYDEDFLWRYTPASAAGDRLRPWLALVVLEDADKDQQGEFTRNDNKLLLPTITVASTASLPPHAQTWAWAHVHINDSFPQETDFEKFLDSLGTPDDPNADKIICRLTSPRHLKANTAYGAFVVPAFETGRLAGLGQDPSNVMSQRPAWTDAPGALELPVLYSWRFRTGENEDFESMVKRLEPQPADARVGVRDMDGEAPGWGLTTGTDIGQLLPADEKQTVIGLEGALKAPTTQSRPATLDPTRPFFAQLASLLNYPDKRRNNPSTETLPVVEPPIYGEYHAQQHTIDPTKTGWVDDLNRDPRHRVPAGFGVSVVRENQASYVARAWAQVQAVLAANRVIRLTAFAMRASQVMYANLAANFAPEKAIAYFSPLLRKIRGSPTTLQHLLTTSTLPPAAVSGAMRRAIRPRGAVARRVSGADATFSHGTLIRGMATGDLTAAPPKEPAADLATDTTSVAELPPSSTQGAAAWIHRFWWLIIIALLLIAIVVGLLAGSIVLLAILLLVAIAVSALILVWSSSQSSSQGTPTGPASIVEPTAVADSVGQAPPQPSFRFVETDPVVPPQATGATQVTTAVDTSSASPNAIHLAQVVSFTPGASGQDSAEAQSFRTAAVKLEQRLAVTVAPPTFASYDLDNANAKILAAVDPLAAFPKRVSATVRFGFDPSWLLEPDHLVPAMAYPDFDDPMYEKLRDMSSELLLPNLNLLPPNSITLLETNPPFIESYLTGLNYEFGKELLWREYPTDQRGSYFRQFWDVRGIMAGPSTDPPAVISERAKDITPLDTWPLASLLGSHRNPQRPAGEQVVLTIRGDLLKKYPRTLVYAQKAHLAKDAQGNPLPDDDPVLADVASDADVQTEIKFPVFKASVDPDITFFGFDLTVPQARGADHPQAETDDWGYYFIIQQLPGEPRFGMDLTFSPDADPNTPITWNDLAWTLFPDGQTFVDTTVLPQSFVPAGPGESISQWGTDSARMASILLQAPVMIAVHAKEMLAGLG